MVSCQLDKKTCTPPFFDHFLRNTSLRTPSYEHLEHKHVLRTPFTISLYEHLYEHPLRTQYNAPDKHAAAAELWRVR